MLKDTQRKVYERTYGEDLNSFQDSSPLTALKRIEERKTARCYELLGIEKGKRILDIGCGNGLKSLKYAERGGVVIGFDITSNGAKAARKRTVKYSDVAFLVADAEHMPFKSSSFDIVSCIAVIEHVENQDKLVSELGRVLRVEGKVLIQTPNKKNKYTVDGTLEKFFPLYDRRRQESVGHLYDRFLTVEGLRKLCLDHRLKIDYIAYTETFVGWIWTHGVLSKIIRFGSRYTKSKYKSQKLTVEAEHINLSLKGSGADIIIRFYNSIVFPMVYHLSLVDKIIEHWGYSGGFTMVGSKY